MTRIATARILRGHAPRPPWLAALGLILSVALAACTDGGSGGSPSSATPSGTSGVSSGSLNTTLALTASVTNSSSPWTFGQAFKDGDVPAGQYVHASNVSVFQEEPRNYWPDGTLKYAVLSGVSNLASGVQATITLTAASSAQTSGSNVPEPSNTSLPNACVVFTPISGDSFSIASGGTYSLDSVLGVQQGTWSGGGQTVWGGTSAGGKVRQMLGPVMSEFDYFQPTSNSNLALWWYVRAYSNGAVEIEMEVENGWFNQSGPSQEDYGVSVYIGSPCGTGTPVYSTSHISWGLEGEPQLAGGYTSNPGAGTLTLTEQSVLDATDEGGGDIVAGEQFYVCSSGATCSPSTIYTVASWNGETFVLTVQSGETLPSTVTAVYIIGHTSHTRWGWVGWYSSANAPIVPAHNASYLMSTKLVPNFGYWNPSTNQPVAITPDSFAWAGLTSTINPPPFWLGDIDPDMSVGGYHQAIGVLSREQSLYAASAASRAYTASIGDARTSAGHWPFFYRDETTGRPVDYLNYATYTFTTGWGTNQPPAVTGGKMEDWNIEHEPSVGYLAYLTESRWSQLEDSQFSASFGIMQASPSNRTGGLWQGSPAENGVVWTGNSPLTDRGGAWAFRTMGQAAALSPRYLGGVAIATSDPLLSTLVSSYVESVHDTADMIDKTFVPTSQGGLATGVLANTIGFVGQYDCNGGSTIISITTVEGSTTVRVNSYNIYSDTASFTAGSNSMTVSATSGTAVAGYLVAGSGIPGGNALASVPIGGGVGTYTVVDPATSSEADVTISNFWAGQLIDGPTATTGLPAGDYVTGVNAIINTLTVNAAALTTGTYSVDYGSVAPNSQCGGAQWQKMYQGVALAATADLGIEGLSNQSALQTVRNFSYNLIVPYMGYGSDAAFQYPNAANYTFPYFNNFTNWDSRTPSFMTVAQQWSAVLAVLSSPSYTAATGQNLYDHNTTAPVVAGSSSSVGGQGYWAGVSGILAYAVDAGFTGASAAWATFTGAANYDPNPSGSSSAANHNDNDTPQFSFVPRTL
jgi:hypothetical protein